jgi:hypothetical protein
MRGVVYPHGVGTRTLNELLLDQRTGIISGALHAALEVWAPARRRHDRGGAVQPRPRAPPRHRALVRRRRARGRQPVRDLWQRRALGAFDDAFAATVPRHGVVMLGIGTPRR